MPQLNSILGRYRDLLRPLLATLSVVFALVTTIFTANHASPEAEVGSSRADGYVPPTFEQSEKLEKVREDFFYAVTALRADEPGVVPTLLDPELQRIAQTHAEGNATQGEESFIDAKVAMIQYNLPVGQARGRALLDGFLLSKEHTDVLLDSRHSFMGVGVAQGHGRVWVVVAFQQ